jgi:multidrug transporter EmrE-like cation transporter
MIGHFKKAATWFWGIVLGIVNFGSIYLLVSALNHVNNNGIRTDSSVIFGLNNIGIVGLSVLVGLLIFSEKLKLINWIGIALSVVSILLFTIA